MPDPRRPDGGLAPNAPIPGRGLPLPAPGEIPTRPVRLLRALIAFTAALTAAASLAVGPAFLIAEIGDGAAAVVELNAGPPDAPAGAQSPADACAWCLHSRSPNGALRGRSPAVVPSSTRSPRTRVRAAASRPGAGTIPAALGSRVAADRWRRPGPIRSEVAPSSRRPRPPPALGRWSPCPFPTNVAIAPTTPPLRGECGSALSSPLS